MFRNLFRDESGFVASAESVLIATVLILGLIVGLTSIQKAIEAELNDSGDAVGNANQSYWLTGMSRTRNAGATVSSFTRGASQTDFRDEGDNDQIGIVCDLPVAEAPK